MTDLSQNLEIVAKQSSQAVISQSGFKGEGLRRYLREILEQSAGNGDSFLADPLFEAAFGWYPGDATMAALAGTLLEPSLVDLLDRPVAAPGRPENDLYRFRREWFPHAHQLESWQALLDRQPRSVLVSSGTGSGKTECFLIPVINDLLRESLTAGRLTGVRALFLYPLNALISSQRDRLTDWTHGFKGRLRYCLYNGMTPEEVKEAEQRQFPSEVLSRKTMRADPAPILVTNITMLEYMLVRQVDHPILEKSQGKLRWIVLDEAHSYVGSQAAELSLLLRRVREGFGVDGDSVRFIATSATIGDDNEKTREELGKFLADLAGVGVDQVTVVNGRRDVPVLPDGSLRPDLPSIEELTRMDEGRRSEALLSSKPIRALRGLLAETVLNLSEASRCLFNESSAGNDPARRRETLQIMGLASEVLAGNSGLGNDRLLPLRVHLFHRSQPGFWACVNPGCTGKGGTALAEGWPYGMVFAHEADNCPHCGGAVFEMVACGHCGESFLQAEKTPEEHLRKWQPLQAIDEFAQDADTPEGDEEGGETDEPVQTENDQVRLRVVVPANLPGVIVENIDPFTGHICDAQTDTTVPLGVMEMDACPKCGGRANRYTGQLYRGARFGAPFLLGNIIPQMLHMAPSRGGKDERRPPAEGRQLITFTDSRQGTARLAAKLQQEAERNLVRGLIYHAVQGGGGTTGGDIEKIQKEIEALEPVVQSNPGLGGMLDEKRAELERLRGPNRVSWKEVVAKISVDSDFRNWVKPYWRDRVANDFIENDLAGLMLYREMLRRPKRQNNAETMGLVTLGFDFIDAITDNARAPVPFRDAGLAAKDWRDFLRVMATYFIRANSAVELPASYRRWIGKSIPQNWLLAPSEERQERRTVTWPKAFGSGRNRMVVMLSRALKLDPTDAMDRDLINDCLLAAWDALRPLLSQDSNGFALDMNKAFLVRVDKAWICPYTGRILPEIFAGLSPYQPIAGDQPADPCVPVQLPRCPFPWLRDETGQPVARERIHDWLTTDPLISAGRDLGIWSDLNDRVAEMGGYLRAAEHSAQQASGLLRRYEGEFKSHKINVLNCSTTMEMGVDIGGLSVVVNSNVPPAPANYRQRIGRAGRRGEGLAVGLTLCKDDPLGWEVFRNPKWPFDHVIQAPRVFLDSPVVVQRHVNSLILATFLRSHLQGKGDTTKTDAGGFFNPKPGADGDLSDADRFIHWCDAAGGLPAEVNDAIGRLLRGTCLDGQARRELETAQQLDDLVSAWRLEVTGLREEQEQLPSSEKSAKKAIGIQLDRLEKSYLLSELAARGFLPGYGFPTHVVPFLANFPIQGKKGPEEREDNRTILRASPARDLSMALAEYAPGSDVVIDGLVYRSAGVTLNWHRPAGAEAPPEPQSMGHAWYCQQCGASDVGHGLPQQCSSCGSTNLTTEHFLRPAGFTVDFGTDPHDDYIFPNQNPRSLPFVSAAEARWRALVDPGLGRVRTTRQGRVFHFSRGEHRHGYALCLHCGRAEAEQGDANVTALSKNMARHFRPRGFGRNGPRCPGADATHAIKRNIALGHDTLTDVVELQLYDLTDEIIACSLAVALREAMARGFGIENSELGWSIASVPNVGHKSVLIYDRASGGAGFSSAAATQIEPLLEAVKSILQCPNEHCQSACHACLLSRDSRHDAHRLDRRKALTFLEEKVLPRLTLPKALQLFGKESRAETSPLVDAIDHFMTRYPGSMLHLWLWGEPSDWDLVSWPLFDLMRKRARRDQKTLIHAPEKDLKALKVDQALPLFRALQQVGGELWGVATMPSDPPLIAALVSDQERIAWGTDETKFYRPVGENEGDASLVIRGSSIDLPDGGTPFDLGARFKTSAMPPMVQIGSQLDGPVNEFGPRFWAHLRNSHPGVDGLFHHGGAVTAISYSDRYLKSPLTIRLLAELLRPLLAAEIGQRTGIAIHFARTHDDGRMSRFWDHDWKQDRLREVVLRRLLVNTGSELSVKAKDSRNMPHARELTVQWQRGRLRINLDQGLGHWVARQGSRFPFSGREQEQIEAIIRPIFIHARATYPTIAYVLEASLDEGN